MVGDGVLVRARACILRGRRVGQGATIGGGAVVADDVEPGATVVGVSAKPIPGSP